MISRLKEVFKSRIFRRLVFYIVSFSSAITLVLTGLQLYRDYRTDLDIIDSRLEQIERVHVKGIVNSLWATDKDGLDIHLSGILLLPDVQYLVVREGETVWASAGEEMAGSLVTRAYPLIYTHRGKPLRIGTLDVVASLDSGYRRLREKALIILLSNGLKTFLVAGFMLLVIHFVLLRHLKSIARFARELRPGALEPDLDLYRPPLYEDDELGELAGTLNSMTGQINQSMALVRLSEERLHNILNSTAEAIYGLDLEGNCTFINPAGLQMLGYDDESELIGMIMHDLIHHTKVDGSPYQVEECKIYGAFLQGQGVHIDDEVLWRKDGTSFPADYSSLPIQSEGKIIGSVVNFLDITERKRAEDLLKDAVQSLAEGFSLWDSDDRLVLFNEKYRDAMSGVTDLLIPGLKFEDMLRALAEQGLRALAIGREEDWVRERMVLHRNPGKSFEMQNTDGRWFMVQECKTQEGGIVAIRSDITERKRAENLLRENEEKFRLMTESTGVISWEADAATFRFTYVSPQAEKLLGFPVEDWLQDDFWAANVHPDDRETALASCQEATKQIVGNDFEYRMISADGRTVWFRDIVKFIPEDKGPDMLRGVMIDITESKRAEEALRLSEERFRALVDNSPASIVFKDTEGHYLIANKQWEAWFKQDDGAAIGKTTYDFFLPEFGDGVTAHDNRILEGLAPEVREYEVTHPDGVTRDVLSQKFPIIGADSQPLGIGSIVTDITERKRAEKSLRESEARFRDIAATASDRFWEMDENLRFTSFIEFTGGEIPPEMECFIGHTRWEAAGSDPETDDKWRRHRDDHLARRPYRDFEFSITGDNGVTLHLSVSGNPVFDSEGTFKGYRGSATDITERTKTEHELLKAYEGLEMRIEHRTRDLRQEIAERKRAEEALLAARDQANAANLAKSEFLCSMSHELRTPLNAILGFGQLLEQNPKDPLTSSQLEHTQQILKGGQHLLELINEVLELARIEAGKVSLAKVNVRPGNIFAECLDLTRTTADETGIELMDLTKDLKLPMVLCDPTRFKQVLINLLSNAVKYNREGGRVTLACRETDGSMLRIEVIDTGPGIPAEMQGEMFQPFCRLGKEASDVEGTGIGLTITKKLVHLMEGNIDFESELGKGSTFWFELPLAGDSAPETEADETHERPPEAHDYRFLKRPLNLLYVEDNRANQDLMEALFARYPNVDLLCTQTAEEGLTVAAANGPDIIIMDINLPGMSGIEALCKLRSSKKTRAIPVIALSASAMPSEVKKGLEAGFLNYLTKPIVIDEVLSAIDDALVDA